MLKLFGKAAEITRFKGLGEISPDEFSFMIGPDMRLDHEIQLVSYQLLLEAATGEKPPSLDLVFLVKTKTPQVIRVQSASRPGRRSKKDPDDEPEP